MASSITIIRKQLQRIMPTFENKSLEDLREAQNHIGGLMRNLHGRRTRIENKSFGSFDGCWIHPDSRTTDVVVLYIHGGGYTCGDLEYSKGFGSTLANKLGARVFCVAYRLAPEAPYPAAIDDCFNAYNFLLECGISPSNIILCGESAGGGICYALCERFKKESLRMPAGIIALSPWLDLTMSSESCTVNAESDVALSLSQLKSFAEHYLPDAEKRREPEASPLFADTAGFPPSLIFVGGGELLYDEALLMEERLRSSGCSVKLIVGKDMWHAYTIYGLKEHKNDFLEMQLFINQVVKSETGLRWMKLDNAAKIYPAAKRKNWNNTFRLSATLYENIDVDVMRVALDATVRRFPSIAARLKRGIFWYYLEELKNAPAIEEERYSPLMHMPIEDIRICALRVIVYNARVAVEFYHALTDGNGGMIFLKSLLAEYIQRKYSVSVPAEKGVLDRTQEPDAAELEDSFLKNSGGIAKSRSEPNSYRIEGIPEKDGFNHLTTLIISSDDLRRAAREHSATVTCFLASVMISAIVKIQDRHIPKRSQKHVKVLIPVDLRQIYGSRTIRNFSLYITPGIDPRQGEWEFDEICRSVHYQMGLGITKKEMTARMTKNVNSERSFILRIMPLFVKNIAMKMVYNAVGEKKACLDISNLGVVDLPEVMKNYVKRFDFLIGPLPETPVNCAVITYNGNVNISFVRNIQKPELEYEFYKVLRDLGISVKVESNQRD